MYTPRFNQVTDRATLLAAMRENSFAILFGPLSGADPSAPPIATHLPLVIKNDGEHVLIQGHFAKANRHWEALAARETLVVFSGPHSYVSPSLYAEPLSVPTWNYIAVHAYGTLEVVEDDTGKVQLLEDLIARHEPAYLDRWRNLPEGYQRSMLGGIVGFHIPVARIEGKFKLSQNRSDSDRDNIRTFHAAGSPDEQSLSRWMTRLGL